MGIVISIAVIVGIILLGNYAIKLGQAKGNNKKLLDNMNKLDK